MLTSFAKVEVVYKNGNRVGFESADGVTAAQAKVVATVLREEIKSVTPVQKAA